MNYSDHRLTELAQTNPQELLRILSNTSINSKVLAAGIEILSQECSNEALVMPILKQLLKHVNAIVREGAMIGVASFYEKVVPPADIIIRLEVISANDPSATLREIAADLVQKFKKINENS